ncbi:MAG TPA: AMP-binding protein [Acidimicrobiales bacterium]|nr:AMP-binding protein [Acidimicrobiales bacterium]
MSGWNWADIWETVADTRPEAPAQVQGKRRVTWAELDRRADGVAQALLDLEPSRQDKVAQYLYNCPEYMESVFGTVKAGLVPVNTNYRYELDELVYLWDNADAIAVVFHHSFGEKVEAIRDRLPKVRGWFRVTDDGADGDCPEWAIPYEEAATSAAARTSPPWQRDGDDLFLLYTGGTTGMPKGVMWRQDDLFSILNGSSLVRHPTDAGIEGIGGNLRELGSGAIGLPACPLMHGTGALTALSVMNGGGCVVTLESRSLDTVELLDAITTERVQHLAIVGDAFAKPLLATLDANPGRWDISSIVLIVSSGVMWSEEVKAGLLRHHPGMLLADAFASSEALGMGTSVSSAAGTATTAKFTLGDEARVIRPDGTSVEPGSNEIGMVAVKGRTPIGYYKDPEKSAVTFPILDGQRWSVPGDHAMVEADGTLVLLGRGSVCINTGGEKVFPEEVEVAVKSHPAVSDALAVGVPDERFGEAICAVVEHAAGATVAPDELIAHVKGQLAAYKAPRHIVVVPSIERAANGKADYKRWKAEAAELLGR